MAISNFDKLVEICEKYAPGFDGSYSNGEYYSKYADGLLEYDVRRYIFVSRLYEYFATIKKEDATTADLFINLFVDNKTTMIAANEYFRKIDINNETVSNFIRSSDELFYTYARSVYKNLIYFDYKISRPGEINKSINIRENRLVIKQNNSESAYTFNIFEKYDFESQSILFKPKLKLNYIAPTSSEYFTNLMDVVSAYSQIISNVEEPEITDNNELNSIINRLRNYTALELLDIRIADRKYTDTIKEIYDLSLDYVNMNDLASHNIFINDRDELIKRLCNDIIYNFNNYVNNNVVDDDFIEDVTVNGIVNFISRSKRKDNKFSLMAMFSLNENNKSVITLPDYRDFTVKDFKYYLFIYLLLMTMYSYSSSYAHINRTLRLFIGDLKKVKSYIDGIVNSLSSDNRFERT